MASNGIARNGFHQEPPASTALAAQIINGIDEPGYGREKFNQLLDESLGLDEAGNPSLGQDDDINCKLIQVVTQAGLQPLLAPDQNDPFLSSAARGRDLMQIRRSLRVIHLAISRSPSVLHKSCDVGGGNDSQSPLLHQWLLPRLVSITALTDDPESSRRAFETLAISLTSSKNASWTAADSIWTFLQACLKGLINRLESHPRHHLSERVHLDANDFDINLNAHAQSSMTVATLVSSLALKTFGQMLTASCRLVTALASSATSGVARVQMKKLVFRLQELEDDLHGPSDTVDDVEYMKADLRNLHFDVRFEQPQHVPSEKVEGHSGDRPKKRIRLSTEAEMNYSDPATLDENLLPAVCRRLSLLLTGHVSDDLSSLASTSLSHVEQYSEAAQCAAISLLGVSACHLVTGSLDPASCPYCDIAEMPASKVPEHEQLVDNLLKTLESFSPLYTRSPPVRTSAVDAFRRLTAHSSGSEHLNVSDSVGGKLCLQTLRSSSREARLASARALQAFARKSPERDSSLVHKNRVTILECLQALWQNDRPARQEAVVTGLCQVAQVVDDEEMNIILLRLIDYLGQTNPYVTSLVTAEISQLAQSLHVPVQGLFRPYWRTLSAVVVKNLTSRPSIAQQVCDLMVVPVSDLLQLMEEHVLPYLVLHGNREIVNRIAVSSSSPMNAFDLCVKPNNLSKILAYLLAQTFSNPEEKIMDLLADVSEEFREQDLAGWLNLNPSQIAFELLKAIGDVGQARASRPFQGLQLLAQLLHRRTTHSSATRKTDQTASFLEANALGIVTLFSVKLGDTEIREPRGEKRRYLIALGEFTRLGKHRVRVALPQVCACLRAALDDPSLCNAAFSSWATMTSSLDEDDLFGIIDQSFAIVVRSWDHLDTKMQQRAYEMISELLKKHTSLIRDVFETIPSLASIPIMAKFEAEIGSLKRQMDERRRLVAYAERLQNENVAVVEQALVELVPTLADKSEFIQRLILREQPDAIVADLTRVLLDCCVKYNSSTKISLLCAQCLGFIGCLDPSKIDNVREKPSIVVPSNFAVAHETTGFLMFFMEHVVVKEYVSASSLRSKGFLGWALQELLKLCELSPDVASRTRVGALSTRDRQWIDLAEPTRLVLTPFLTSRFSAPTKRKQPPSSYPIYKPGKGYQDWLTELVLDLSDRGSGRNVDIIFEICWRMVFFSQGSSIASFLLPYVALNLVLNGIDKHVDNLSNEMMEVLSQPLHGLDFPKQETVRQCSQSIFDILDYMSKWVQEKKKWLSGLRSRAERGIRDPALEIAPAQIQHVEAVIRSIPLEVVTQRAIECKSFARALFHWEEYMHSMQDPSDEDYRRLQDIYAQIDEPDGIEGISAKIRILDAESQVLEHKKAGRWQAAQNWYEMQLTEQPANVDVQVNLLTALKESGQHDVLLHHFDGLTRSSSPVDTRLIRFAVEAAWASNRWDKMSAYLAHGVNGDFATKLGSILLAIKEQDPESTTVLVEELLRQSASEMTYNSTVSFSAAHEAMLKTHVLHDVQLLTSAEKAQARQVLEHVRKRLQILGTNVADKQYVLSIHRAIMNLKSDIFSSNNVASSWCTTAKLARKARATNQAFDAVLRATSLGDESSTIEQAKLTWLEGQHRKAITTLEGAIRSNAFGHYDGASQRRSNTSSEQDSSNDTIAKAYQLLGKWLDQAGQTQSDVISKTFRKSTEHNRRWEKGWYCLGRHYNRILESERTKPPGKESQPFLTGEAAKIVIENFLRAIACGNKFLFQTLPKVLTLWLELVTNPELEQDVRRGNSKFHEHNASQRKKVISETNTYIKKYVERLQPTALYTILPQIVARICHTNQTVYDILQTMVVKVIRSFPQQALWTLMAMTKSSDKTRSTRGHNIITRIMDAQKRDSRSMSAAEMKMMVSSAQKFGDELLRVADYNIEGKVPKVSLARDLGFNHKIAPSKLVVPCESCLTPNIIIANDANALKSFRPFSNNPTTISSFLDEALVLSSLQKPRKLSIRGSDGEIYGVLAKPKDDLRKDQRLMEFNTMINRFLKRDIDASKRQLYIRTYAVVPLNEECGLIEWVNNLKTMRDVLLRVYRERGQHPDYGSLRNILDDICTKSTNKAKDFTERVLCKFPAVLRYWFVETFPDPSNWFAARLRYTRSSSVMSIVGHVLGLGDRHGENILFEEDNGGILHVDFNCLFDKGLTFDKPECVPFRLTHNMVDAFGAYGYDGPFRRSCEITLTLLRNNEDGLMTILETFLHDPTTDFMTAGKRKKVRDPSKDDGGLAAVVPDTAEKMLEAVRAKLRGMLVGESVPLSVAGYVDEMINRSADRANLARMYIGWCAFL